MPVPRGYQYRAVDTDASKFALPPSLWIPIAAVSVDVIREYVGQPHETTRRDPSKAVFVTVAGDERPPFNDLPIWKMPLAGHLHDRRQAWVHVDYSGYRSFFASVFPEINDTDWVVDHVCNRRFARALGYAYVRLIAVSRGANSSSGRGPESEALKFITRAEGLKTAQRARTPVQYADPADIAKMLDIQTGGFPLNSVRDLLAYLGPSYPA